MNTIVIFSWPLLIALLMQIDWTAASYNNSAGSCAFLKPGVSTCQGKGTSDVADALGILLDGKENYALLALPYDIYILIDVDYVWNPSVQASIYSNGVFAYVVFLYNQYIIIENVGCPKISELTNSGTVITGTSLTFSRIYKALYLMRQPYVAQCNVMTGRDLIGPYPKSITHTANNQIISTETISSAIIQLNASCGLSYSNLKGIIENHNVYVIAVPTQAGLIIAQPGAQINSVTCNNLNQQFGLTQALTAYGISIQFQQKGQFNQICQIVTAVAQILASKANTLFLTFIKLVIFERTNSFLTYLAGFTTSQIFYGLLDPFFNLC